MCPPAPSLEPGAIRAVVRAHVGEMGKACYEPMLKRFPEAEGKVAIKFEIDPNGDIFLARIEQGMLADATAQKCILDVFRALHFPPPNGGSMDVIYPIMFKPGG